MPPPMQLWLVGLVSPLFHDHLVFFILPWIWHTHTWANERSTCWPVIVPKWSEDPVLPSSRDLMVGFLTLSFPMHMRRISHLCWRVWLDLLVSIKKISFYFLLELKVGRISVLARQQPRQQKMWNPQVYLSIIAYLTYHSLPPERSKGSQPSTKQGTRVC